MIDDDVFLNWATILANVWSLIISNPITAFAFGSFIVTIVANLIYRLTTTKNGES